VSYRATGFAAPFLPTGYDSSNYSRSSSSSERLAPPRHAGALSAFGIADSDPVNFSLDPDAAGLKVPPSLSDSNLVAQAEMSFAFPADPSANGYRGANAYDQSRSPSMRDFTYSSVESSQRRTSSASSYGIGSNLGGPQYGRAGSVASSQDSYLGGISPPAAAYNSIPYQSGYGVNGVNPQSMCNPSHAPTIPGMMDAGPPGYRSRQLSSASSVSSEPIKILETRAKPQCWEHGCNGRQFSTFSNLLRHQREKSGTAAKSYCPRCNAEFTRTTARNGHMQHEKCKPRSSEER
jgi:hypothetical protein